MSTSMIFSSLSRLVTKVRNMTLPCLLKGSFSTIHPVSPSLISSHPRSLTLSTGAISLWGKVDEVDPPHLVMPLTVEPTKPSLCNDNRFLNLWIADRPFQLDHLRDIVRYTPLDSCQTICDL